MDDSHHNFLSYARFIPKLINFRVLAYTSEFGEAIRPIAHKNIVRGAYGISFAYIGLSIFHTLQHSEEKSEALKKELVFHSMASLILPAIGVGSVTQGTKFLLKNIKHPKIKFVPSIVGLISIPLMITPIDNTVEHYVNKYFE